VSTEDPRETLPRTPAAGADRPQPARPSPEATQAISAPPQQAGWPGARATSPDDDAPRPPAAGASPSSSPAPERTAATGPGASGGAAAAAPPSAPTTAPTTVLPPDRRPERPTARPDRSAPQPARGAPRPATRPAGGRGRRARLVLQRVDPWSVFLFSLVASICLGIVLLVAVVALYGALSSLGVLSSLNTVLSEVLGGADEVGAPFFTLGRVLGATAVLAAVDVVLLTILATLSALLYNLCASLTGGIEVVLGERD